ARRLPPPPHRPPASPPSPSSPAPLSRSCCPRGWWTASLPGPTRPPSPASSPRSGVGRADPRSHRPDLDLHTGRRWPQEPATFPCSPFQVAKGFLASHQHSASMTPLGRRGGRPYELPSASSAACLRGKHPRVRLSGILRVYQDGFLR